MTVRQRHVTLGRPGRSSNAAPASPRERSPSGQAGMIRTGTDWGSPRLDQLLRVTAALPPGTWTTYGDVAELIVLHPVPVGAYIGNNPVPNGGVLLTGDGSISPGFRWDSPDDHRGPRDVLQSEGLEFDDRGRAAPEQRLRASELLALVDPESDVPALTIPSRCPSSVVLRGTLHAPTRLLATRSGMRRSHRQTNGSVAGDGRPHELRRRGGDHGSLRAFASRGEHLADLYLSRLDDGGRVSASKGRSPPFDRLEMRDKLRRRLNRAPEIDLPRAKLDLRPSFPIDLLVDSGVAAVISETLGWFVEAARMPDQVNPPPIDPRSAGASMTTRRK